MILIPGTAIGIPGSEISRRPTRAEYAWLGGTYSTVRLHGVLRALRVHVGAGEGAASGANVHLVSGAALHGNWYAIGDFVQPYDEYIATRAIPKTRTRFGRRSIFNDAAIVTFAAGVVLNIGRAAPLFGHRGGGEQAEFVDGPEPSVEPMSGLWGREYGHA
jgi:hypothetical protein